MTSMIHQIPKPPKVISFKIPRPTCPIINLSTPSWPKTIDITSAKTQFTSFNVYSFLNYFTKNNTIYYIKKERINN